MHTVKRVCTLVLTGLLALPMAAPAGAAAASFSDLPSSHWAYIAMTEAAGYGILQGTGANTMSPSAPLTWPQFLAMAARAFAPEEYARSAASGAAWDQAGLDAARSAGLLEGLDEAALTGAVTRQDAALLLCNALPEEYTPSFWDQPIDPTALSDWGRMDSLRQEAVAELARRCVIQGKADGSFGYADPLQRCDGAVLLMRVLEQVDNSCRGESQTVTLHILNADTGEALLPDQQVETEVSTYLSSLANGLDVGYYVYDYDRETASYTSTACDSYTLYFRPMTGAEIQEEQFWEKVERGEAAYEDYYKQDFWLSFQGDNARKHILLFGDESKSRFASQEEAAAAMTTVTVPVWQLSGGEKVSSTLTLSVHAALAEDVKEIFTEIYNDPAAAMTTVTVPVWQLSGGEKVSSTLTLSVHAALAEDVKEIFTEIYNDPERFPIHDVGGYAWRGDSATGEHNCGTAIDINANENYQIRDGQVLAGSCWEPGSNAYSISPDSSVVRIFAEHGWSWGGDAWAYSSDDSEGYHDYMHFSYMGE